MSAHPFAVHALRSVTDAQEGDSVITQPSCTCTLERVTASNIASPTTITYAFEGNVSVLSLDEGTK